MSPNAFSAVSIRYSKFPNTPLRSTYLYPLSHTASLHPYLSILAGVILQSLSVPCSFTLTPSSSICRTTPLFSMSLHVQWLKTSLACLLCITCSLILPYLAIGLVTTSRRGLPFQFSNGESRSNEEYEAGNGERIKRCREALVFFEGGLT